MALATPSDLNNQINALKRLHYAAQSEETKEESRK